jgi:proline dehydrogenase
METSALARRLAARFVAGDTWADGLEAGRRINREGIAVTFDRLGESVTSLAEAEASRDEYMRVLAEISDHHLDANVSNQTHAVWYGHIGTGLPGQCGAVGAEGERPEQLRANRYGIQ